MSGLISSKHLLLTLYSITFNNLIVSKIHVIIYNNRNKNIKYVYTIQTYYVDKLCF